MADSEDTILMDLVIGILGGVSVVQGIVLFLYEEWLYYTVGLWIGASIAIGLAVHMKRSIEDALDIGEEGAGRHMMQKSLLRGGIVLILFLGVAYFQVGSLLTMFIGAMSLKFAAYLQPYVFKVRKKLRKGG